MREERVAERYQPERPLAAVTTQDSNSLNDASPFRIHVYITIKENI